MADTVVRKRLELSPAKTLRVGGAHDALSAALIERAGFPAIWLSGFGVAAAQFALPDSNLVTATESAEAARRVASSVGIPVIVDADNGFGDAFNAGRVVGDYGRAGVAAVCLEDNAFPKRCSLWAGAPRRLLPVPEMQEKIAAARKAADPFGMLLIGRVESLIAELGPEDAVRRAQAYAEAGADAILIHARKFPPLREIALSGKVPKPLVVVPTLFPDVGFSELSEAGFAAVVYANQVLRAMVRAEQMVLSVMLRAERPQELDGLISTVDEVNRLVRVPAEWFAEKPAAPPAAKAQETSERRNDHDGNGNGKDSGGRGRHHAARR